jgi:hypothetical protein
MNRYGNNTDTDWLLAGSPSGAFASSIRQEAINADLAALTTQVMTSVAVPVQAGDVITNVTFKSGATAAGTPTNWWFAVYSAAATPALLGQTADQTSTAWGANTPMTLALATPVLVSAAGVLYVACMVKATTVPTLIGANLSLAGAAGAIAGSKVRAQTSGSALTTTAPATIASPTTVATVPYAVLT